MQRLNSEEFPHLSEYVLQLLHLNRITTIVEFLQEDVITLAMITKLSLQDIMSTRNDIFLKYSAPVCDGKFLNDQCSRFGIICTDLQSFDILLHYGIPRGYITEFCGLADSGKTQLCFDIAINCASRLQTILYVDTKGDFSAIRLQNILAARNYSHEKMADIMLSIKVIRIWTMDELIELLKQIKDNLIPIENIELIIIDSLPCLMLQFCGDENKIGLSLLNTFFNYSRYVSKGRRLGIICVNIQTRWIDQDVTDLKDDAVGQSTYKDSYVEKRNRCLGKYWRHLPILVVNLEKCEKDSQTFIKASVMKSHRSFQENRDCSLFFRDDGLRCIRSKCAFD